MPNKIQTVKMKSDVFFTVDDDLYSWKIQNGALSILKNDELFTENGDWIFPFPDIVDGKFTIRGIDYVIPVKFIDRPLVELVRGWPFIKRLFSPAVPMNRRIFELVKEEEIDKSIDSLLITYDEKLTNQELSFPYRIVERKNIIDYLIRFGLWDALRPAIRGNAEVFPEYFENRVYAMLTNTRVFIPMIYNTSNEYYIMNQVVVNRAYPEYQPKGYEPILSGENPGEKGLYSKKGNVLPTINPYVDFMEPKRAGIFLKNYRQALSLNTQISHKDPSDVFAVGFVEPKDLNDIFEDAFIIDEYAKGILESSMLVSEVIPRQATLLVKEGDLISPFDAIAEMDDELLHTKKLAFPGFVMDIITKENVHKILIKGKYPFNVGDKLSSIHGWKGIVSEIVPDSKISTDIIVSSKRLTPSTILEGIYSEYLSTNENAVSLQEFLKEAAKLKNIKSIMDKFNVHIEKTDIIYKDKIIKGYVLYITMMRLAQNAADKLTYNKDVIYTESSLYVRTVSKRGRFQRLGRDVIMISKLLGIDMLKRKKNKKLAKTIYQFYTDYIEGSTNK